MLTTFLMLGFVSHRPACAAAPPAIITAVATEVHYLGMYPAAPMTEGGNREFEVRVTVHLRSHAAWSGGVEVSGSWGAAAEPVLGSVPAGESNLTVVVPATGRVSLWW